MVEYDWQGLSARADRGDQVASALLWAVGSGAPEITDHDRVVFQFDYRQAAVTIKIQGAKPAQRFAVRHVAVSCVPAWLAVVVSDRDERQNDEGQD